MAFRKLRGFTLHNMNRSKLFVEVPQKVGSTHRKATDAEIAASNTLKAKLDLLRLQRDRLDKEITALERRCKHVVVYDVPGYMYDVRNCNACGETTGTV